MSQPESMSEDEMGEQVEGPAPQQPADVRSALAFRAAKVYCLHPEHGLHGLALEFRSRKVLEHLNTCFGDKFATQASLNPVMKDFAKKMICTLDQAILVCKGCGNLRAGSGHNLRKHTQHCLGFALSRQVCAQVVDTCGQSSISYETVFDLARLPETHQAILSGQLHTHPMLACPADLCFAAFPPGDREALITHIKNYHTKARGSRDLTLADIAKSAPVTMTATFGRSSFVRIIDSRHGPAPAQAQQPPLVSVCMCCVGVHVRWLESVSLSVFV